MVIGLIYLILLIGQLGMHFWPGWSFVSGIKVDYLSPTLYLTDLVWGIGLIFNFSRWTLSSGLRSASQFLIKKFKNDWKNRKRAGLDLPVLLACVVINVLVVSRWQVVVYGWFRLAQLWWWAGYFSKYKEEVIKLLRWVIPWWIGIETFLILGQVIGGGSMGGLFYWLGERRFDYMSLGIARIAWFGDQYVRAYGTFSHPNSLAGFLLVGLVMWNEIYITSGNKNRRSFSRRGGIRMTLVGKVKQWMVFWIGVVGIILTGSRLVWTVGILIFLLKMIKGRMQSARTRFGLIFTGLGVFMMIFAVLIANIEIVGGWSVNSLDLRWKLLKSGWEMWKQNWLLGVGINNFLVNLPEFMKGYWWLQPVHNIFMLILTEVGILGTIWLVLFLVKRIDFKKYAWVWVVIILTGMFDHYWLTLPQNIGLLGLIMGLSKKPLPVPPLDKGGENN